MSPSDNTFVDAVADWMGHSRGASEAVVHATSSALWMVLTDATRYPDWVRGVRSVDGIFQQGARLHVEFDSGQAMSVRIEHVRFETGFSLRSKGQRIDVTLAGESPIRQRVTIASHSWSLRPRQPVTCQSLVEDLLGYFLAAQIDAEQAPETGTASAPASSSDIAVPGSGGGSRGLESPHTSD